MFGNAVETGHAPSLLPDNDKGDMRLFDSLRSLTMTASIRGNKNIECVAAKPQHTQYQLFIKKNNVIATERSEWSKLMLIKQT